MTEKEFTQKYFDLLTVTYPSAKFTIVDHRTIETKIKDNAAFIYIDNAYKAYQSQPGALNEILSGYLKYMDSLNQADDEQLSVDKIMPTIKPVGYFGSIRNTVPGNTTIDVECVHEKYNDQLVIAYANDFENNIRALSHADLKSLSISEESVKAIAIKNLSRILTNVQRKGGDGVYMLIAGGFYESSLILLDPIFTKETLPVKGEFVIAIPNRDVLLITGSDDQAGIAKVKAITQKIYQTGNYPLTPVLFKWNGQIFEKFE